MIIASCNSFNGRSQRKQLSYSASSLAIVNAKNSDFINDCAIRVCFLDFHEMPAPPMVKTKPPVDLHSFGSKHQLASEKPSIIVGYPV